MFGAWMGTIFMICIGMLGLYIMGCYYNKENPISLKFVKLKVRKFRKRRDIIARCGLRWLKLRAYHIGDGQYQCVTIGNNSFKAYGLMRKTEKAQLLRAVTDRINMEYKWLQMIEILTPRGGTT